ncbi:MAG: LCP family protein [Thermoleophilia bacterium]
MPLRRTGGQIDVNYVIKINFRGFRQVVDKVGGVYVDVDHRYFNDNSTGTNFATINIQPGYQRLSGTQALDYARYRHGDSDFFRIARQQLFVRAFKQQVQGAVDPLKLIGVVNAITSNLQVVAGGGKKADADTILSYAKFLYDLPGGSFYQVNLGGITQDAQFGLHVPESSVSDAVEKFLNPDTEAATKATATATKTGATKVVGTRPADTTVAVLNGSTTEGAATLAAAELGKLGYQAEAAGNAETSDFFDSQVLFDPGVKGARVSAERMAQLFDTEDVRPNAALDTTLQVIVGQTFHSGLAPAAKDDTPESGRPQTTLDVAPALEALRPLARRVSFPVLVPRFRETSSRLSSGGAEAVRAYKIKGKDAVKLVYQVGGQAAYWGIMQTAWTDAPILTGASVERTIKGRDYKLWFNGSKLHMIAFEENGAAYWVTNTLDDRFSNETMIAIAKGLVPLDSAA